MKRIVKIMAILLVAMAMATQGIDARNNNGRGNGHNNASASHQAGKRPSGNNGNHNAFKPGNNGNHNGNNGNHNAFKPGKNGNHNGNFGHAPNPGHNGGNHFAPPAPSHKPHNYWPNFHRPTPPHGYVYHSHGPSFGSILGMMIGTAFNASLSYLNNNGYHVASYGDNTIYLNNVSQMNLLWPNAALYYNNGMLTSSQYIYSSQWNDASRYNRLYNNLCNQYGAPASINNMGGLMSASWFGYDGRFVSIQYSQGYNANGMGCFYTTLSFGN